MKYTKTDSVTWTKPRKACLSLPFQKMADSAKKSCCFIALTSMRAPIIFHTQNT